MALTCVFIRKILERSFSKSRWPRLLSRWLWNHLAACDSCRGLYDRAMLVDRMLAHQGQTARLPSALELELLAPVVASRAMDNGGPVGERRPVWIRQWATAAAAIATTGVLVTAVWKLSGDSSDGWRARGKPTQSLSVRALCELLDAAGNPLIRSLSKSPGPGEVSHCPVNGRLRFAYLHSEGGVLSALAGQLGGSWHWISPASPDEPPLQLAPANRLSPLPISVDLGGYAPDKPLDCFFALSREAMSVQEVQGCAEKLRGGGACDLPSDLIHVVVPLAPAYAGAPDP